MNRAKLGVSATAIVLMLYAGAISIEISFSIPHIFHKADWELSKLYMVKYMPDYPIEVTNRENGTIDTVPLSELGVRASAPYMEFRDTLWVTGFIEFQTDSAELDIPGVYVGSRWNHSATVRYPLWLLPVLDTVSCIKWIRADVRVHAFTDNQIRIPDKTVIGSDTCTHSFAANTFFIKVKDFDVIDLDALKKSLQSAFKPIDATFILSCGCRVDSLTVTFDSLMHRNVLHVDLDYPVYFFDYFGEQEKAEKAFEEFVDRRPILKDVLEFHFLKQR